MSTYLEDNYIVTVTLLLVIGCLVIFFLVLKLGGTSEKKTTLYVAVRGQLCPNMYVFKKHSHK